MKETLIIAGFGGQGVLSMGKILAYSGVMQDFEVTWMPSYGPEMRGGTANVTVILSDRKISSPIAHEFDTAIILNQQSMDKFEAKVADARIGTEKVVLVKPQTFMNLSGQCVTELVSWYKPEMDHLLLVYDDIDLPLGKLRMREKGSAGTHNGMRSVIGLLGRQDFPRLRVGVGKKPEGWELADWVLSHYQTEEDRKTQFNAFLRAADVVEDWVKNGLESAMRMANAPV